MFTGIIEELGTIAHMDRRPDSIRLTIQAHKVLEGTQLGDSIAVNGVCLTVTDMTDSTFSADVMHETMRRSSFSTIKSGSQVNLERAMQVGGRWAVISSAAISMASATSPALPPMVLPGSSPFPSPRTWSRSSSKKALSPSTASA